MPFPLFIWGPATGSTGIALSVAHGRLRLDVKNDFAEARGTLDRKAATELRNAINEYLNE